MCSPQPTAAKEGEEGEGKKESCSHSHIHSCHCKPANKLFIDLFDVDDVARVMLCMQMQ